MNAAPSDHERSLRLYQRHAARYDASALYTMPLRRRTIALLDLRPGQTVLDVGCGTGLSYPLLNEAVGSQGRVLGFEQSPDMFERAQQRVADHGWNNVWHERATAEDVQLPQAADAALFNYVHDISRSSQAVANIMRQVKPGAHVAIAGIQFFPWFLGPLNILPWLKNRPYNARAADLWHPWDVVETWCDDFHRWTTQAGMGYIAHGRRRKDLP